MTPAGEPVAWQRPPDPRAVPAGDTTARTDAVTAAHSLPAWTYRDPEFFELEREHVFLPAWHLVCHVSDVPRAGDYATFRLLGELALVVRGNDGVVRAFHNVCRHRAARLLDASYGHVDNCIRCPYHAWTYGLDGRLIAVPGRSQYDMDESAHGLVPLECEVLMGMVFVRFRSGGPGVRDALAPILDELAPYRIEEMRPLYPLHERLRAANWKNANDNYNDALHVRAAHPGLSRLIGRTYTLAHGGPINMLCGEVEAQPKGSWSVRAYAKLLPEVAHLPESKRRLWLYYQVWPNLCFNLYPDQVELMQFVPVSPTQTIVRDAAYALPDDSREMRAAQYLNVRVNRRVGLEDQDLIERVQDGMASSSFTTGPFGRNEVCLRGLAERMRTLIPVSRLERAPAPGTVARVDAEMRAR
jgi:phenylpropionate dioxygenase-like ring-hydroxylating dioxygenase large terminal subunit